MPQKKLCIGIASYSFPNLSETFILNQITGLINRGHDVHILAFRKPNDKQHQEIHKYQLLQKLANKRRLPEGLFKRICDIIFMATYSFIAHPIKSIRSFRPHRYGSEAIAVFYGAMSYEGPKEYDMVLAHFGYTGLWCIRLRELGVFKAPIATFFHGFDMSTYINFKGQKVYNQLFSTGDYFFPISQIWYTHLIALGCPSENTKVHRVGVDCNKFFPIPHKPSKHKLQILSVCRLVEKKGIHYAIEAVYQLIKQGIKNFRYNIVGEGSLRDSLQNQIESNQLQKYICLQGEYTQDKVIEIMRNADLILQPSATAHNGDTEGIPVTLMEAMAMGKPVLSTYHSGIPELIDDQVCGRLVQEKNSQALADTLKEFLTDPDSWEKFGRTARQKVLTEFCNEKLCIELENFLHNFALNIN